MILQHVDSVCQGFSSEVIKEKYLSENCFGREGREKPHVLHINLLQSEIICSQPGIVDLQNDSGIVNSSCEDLQ